MTKTSAATAVHRAFVAFAALALAQLVSAPAWANCEIDRATFRPVLDSATGAEETAMGNVVSSPGPGPTLRAYAVGSELIWELSDDRAASAAGRGLPLLFRTGAG